VTGVGRSAPARTVVRRATARARRFFTSVVKRARGDGRDAASAPADVDRYLQLLEAGLLNELYLDHELRLVHLSECLRLRAQPDKAKLGDPVREMPLRWQQLVERRRHGAGASRQDGDHLPYADFGAVQLAQLRTCLDLVRDDGVEGDFVDCAPGRGGAGIYMRGYAVAFGLTNKRVVVVDDFRVRPRADDPLDVWTDLPSVRDGFARFDLLDDEVRFVAGRTRDDLTRVPVDRACLVRFGRGESVEFGDALDVLGERLAAGGIVIVDGYDDAARRQTVERFREAHGDVVGPLQHVGPATVWWRSSGGPGRSVAAARPVRSATVDLSIVVVMYNMRREAARTLHSLTRTYQRDIDGLEYEVIVVENGSAPEHALGEEYVRSFGPEFSYVDLGPTAPGSPVTALNRGFEASRGAAIAFMIDGAHLLTPGVLHYALLGLRTYAPAVVLTQLFYVGPGQQPEMVRDGYDQAIEDQLFEEIAWPEDGYRLFEIGSFFGDRDWFDGMWESNCIFVPRSLIEQSGAFDPRFAIPGGGYTNSEFYLRMVSSPGVHPVTMLGEGSFHQVHGGTTTNADPHERAAVRFAYGDQFEELTGRPFGGVGKRVHYVGSMFPGAARTKARRSDGARFLAAARDLQREPGAERVVPVPEDLRSSFTEAFWRSGAWRDVTWLGHPAPYAPTDLFVYQELVARTRPDWIIETGTGTGGRALLFATICELVGHGSVVSIDRELAPGLPAHPRLHYVDGPPAATETITAVRALVGAPSAALVVLGGGGTSGDVAVRFAAYRSFVTPGSYLIVEHTAVNGHPVATGAGPGPYEAVRRIVARDREFVIDSSLERYGLTFNPIGYLKRKE
jgi:cephalosporin hydroxylase